MFCRPMGLTMLENSIALTANIILMMLENATRLIVIPARKNTKKQEKGGVSEMR